jgi:hypothetical protein
MVRDAGHHRSAFNAIALGSHLMASKQRLRVTPKNWSRDQFTPTKSRPKALSMRIVDDQFDQAAASARP